MLINLLTNLANTKTVAEEFLKSAKAEGSITGSSLQGSHEVADVAIPSVSSIIESVTGYRLNDIKDLAISDATTDPHNQDSPSLERVNNSNNLFNWIAKGFEGLQSFVSDPLGTTINVVSEIPNSETYKKALKTVPGLDEFVRGVNKIVVESTTETIYEKQQEQKQYEEQQYLEEQYAEKIYLAQLEEQQQEAEKLGQEAYEKQQLEIAEAEQEAEEARQEEAYEEELEEQERIKKEKEAKALAELKLDQRLIDIANSHGIEIDPCCISNSELLNKLVRVIDEDSLAEALAAQGKDTSALFNHLMKTGKQVNFKTALTQIVSNGTMDTKNILAA
jgi:hypothetical protein